ncbi:ATP phosphoribosyltransferase [Methanosalsum zhilinae DSM 4017]|uniref:ATP phosphoribosyltransferase n=1 Tax=Methanosalsum zhilinae (strain DSM 4017 / NBRC 107636 / OCM 62 / WeN5) TaxID=679901 RepID=F7XMV5_METZD|nr:ATP phosphoribosyltransferase [Methanosalsum zhilinae]AEH59972.1 ATP phosphoribosyltransferase [Methanosalsum zhilinae DSM 4017]
MIRIAIPNKGRLHDPALALFREAGLPVLEGGTRKLFARTSDPEISVLFARAADIPEYVQDGAADVGITGLDLISETGASVELMLDLNFGHADLVLAVPDDIDAASAYDLEGMRVATEFPEITRKYFEKKGIRVDIINVSGACEITPHVGIADAIVDISSSGTTLIMNHLRAIDTVFSSSVYLISNHESLIKKDKIYHIKTALESVLRAKGKRYLMMNVPADSLKKVKDVLPGLAGPTVMKVESDETILAVHAVISSDSIFATVNSLKEVGATDILVVPIERMMP